MLERLISGSSLKINIYSFILIILYAIYAFLGVNPLRINASIPNLESPNYPDYVLISVATIIIAVMLYGIIKAKWSSRECGFNIDKSFWQLSAIFVVMMIFIVAQAPQVISFKVFLDLIPIFLFITGSEIILRVLLMNSILNSISNHKWASTAAIVLSAILFAVVHSPMEELNFSRMGLNPFFLSFGLSLLYIHYGSFVFLVIGDMTLYTRVEYILMITIMAFVFYIPVVFIGRHFEKKPITTAGMG